MGFNRKFAEAEPPRPEIDAIHDPLVLEFGAPWCGHCLAAQPLIEQAFAAHPEIRHLKVEDGPGQPLGRSFRVKLWPTLVFMRDGKELERLVRPTDPAAIARALAAIASPA